MDPRLKPIPIISVNACDAVVMTITFGDCYGEIVRVLYQLTLAHLSLQGFDAGFSSAKPTFARK
jgi:hypothetical protein